MDENRFENVIEAVRMIKAGNAASVEEAALKMAIDSGKELNPDDYKIVGGALKVRV